MDMRHAEFCQLPAEASLKACQLLDIPRHTEEDNKAVPSTILRAVGVPKARSNVSKASGVNLFDAARANKAEDVELVCFAFPERVNQTDGVR